MEKKKKNLKPTKNDKKKRLIKANDNYYKTTSEGKKEIELKFLRNINKPTPKQYYK